MDNHPLPETRWYRVPLLWLGIAILLASLAGSVHLIVVSRAYHVPDNTTGEGQSFRGVPLTREPRNDTESAP